MCVCERERACVCVYVCEPVFVSVHGCVVFFSSFFFFLFVILIHLFFIVYINM